MEKRVKYAIGDQDFKSLRENDCLYIDKTNYIERLLSFGNKYYFLARPRRFGKSLFLSTLKYFFKGERELFRGLYIDSTDWQWETYPVLHLDLNPQVYEKHGLVDVVINTLFREWEKEYGVEEKETDLSARFGNIIKTAHAKTGKQVIILVDEYDKPLVRNLNNDELFEHYRKTLAGLYSNFKTYAAHIKLVFLTGVSRFSKLSVFSDLNNLNDITFSNEFADICGITEKELLGSMQQGIRKIADYFQVTPDEAIKELKKNYDGYRFAARGSDIYNPWSLLCAMNEGDIRPYWNMTGFPSIIVEALKRINADLEKALNKEYEFSALVGLDLRNPDPTALMYQTGYLTIKAYNPLTRIYTLGMPNEEVKDGFFRALLPHYVTLKRVMPESIVTDMYLCAMRGNPKELMETLDLYFAGIPYELKIENENNFQNAFYILVTLLGIKTRAEVSTSDGRIDILIDTPDYIYIIELKYDKTAFAALRQIEQKRYADAFKRDGKVIFRIGANFSSKTRRFENICISEEIH